MSKTIGETLKTRRFYPELFKMTDFVSANTYQLNENKLKCTVCRIVTIRHLRHLLGVCKTTRSSQSALANKEFS